MKILYIIHDFLPKHQAGAEIYTYLLARELSQNHQVCLFFTEIQNTSSFYAPKKRSVNGLECIEVFRPPEASMHDEPYNDKKMEDIFYSIIKDYKPDIIHIHHLLYHSLNYPEIASKEKIPVVFTLHDYWLTCPRWGQRLQRNLQVCLDVNLHQCSKCMQEQPAGKSSSLLRQFQHFFYATIGKTSEIELILKSLVKRKSCAESISNHVDLFIAPSNFLKQELIKFGFPEKKIILSDNGSDPQGYTRKKTSPDGKIRFGYIGTISEHKGLHILIKAFNEIPENKADLDIYGDLSWFPRYSKQLKAISRSSSISFKGSVPNAMIPATLSNIDVLVVPSIWFENSPLTIHEAFMAGVPVITSNFGGMADLVTDRVNGLLFEAGNSESLKHAIEEILNSNILLASLSQRIPKVKTIQENGVEMEKIYFTLVNQ